MSEQPWPANRNTAGEYCTLCGAWIPPTGDFCPNCGAIRASLRTADPTMPIYPTMVRTGGVKRPTQWRRLIKTGSAYGMLSVLIQLLLSLVTLVYGIGIVLPEIVRHEYSMIIITPMIVEIGTISGDLLGAYYILLVIAILLSAVWLFASSALRYKNELEMKAEPRKHSAFFDLCGLLFGVLFLNMVVVLFVEMFGGAADSPVEGADLWELLFLLANASVWEELIVRVLMIGFPLLIFHVIRHSFAGKTRPYKIRKYLLGGGMTIGAPEVVLVILSSAMFGLGHYEGWGAWKVFPSAVAGIAFGYMFLKHGLAGSIMLHFAFDYLSLPSEVFTGSSLSILLFLGLSLLLWLGLGSVFFGYYIVRIAEYLTGREYLNDPTPVTPTYRSYPAVVGYPQVRTMSPQQMDHRVEGKTDMTPMPGMMPGFGSGFVCPRCGNTQARWTDGRFQCLRCGNTL